MGFRFRRRTKGKKFWLNFSKSGVSASYKIGPLTINGGHGKFRGTYNLGNGLSYVAYSKKKKKPVAKKPVAKPVYKTPVVQPKVIEKPRPPVKELTPQEEERAVWVVSIIGFVLLCLYKLFMWAIS